MRCLTLASSFEQKGYECVFVCRKLEGNMIDYISEKYLCLVLNKSENVAQADDLTHSKWLGSSQENDSEMILGETALSFLGLGLRPPVVSWGVLLQDAQNLRSISLAPWLLTPGHCGRDGRACL